MFTGYVIQANDVYRFWERGNFWHVSPVRATIFETKEHAEETVRLKMLGDVTVKQIKLSVEQ